MIFKKIFSDSLIYAIGPQIPKIASLFILPLITPYLNSLDYGIAGIILAYTSFLTSLSDLGFPILLMNTFFNYKKNWLIYWRQYHFYLSLWSVFYSIILSILLYFVIPIEAKSAVPQIIFLFVVPSLLFNTTILIAVRYYQLSRKPLYVALVSSVVGIISIFINFYTIVYLKLGYLGWFISSFFSTVITFAFYFYPIYFKYKIIPILKFRRKFIAKSLKITLPVIPHNYSGYLLNTSDRVVMERLKIDTSSIGNYNLAYTFGSYMEIFGNAIGMAIAPLYTNILSSKEFSKEDYLRKLTNLLQISFIVFSFIVSLWSKELFIALIKNNQLNELYPIAIIIIMSYAYRPYYWDIISKIQFNENTKDLWKITLVGGVLNVILNFVFIPIYGIKAAALSTFICLIYIGFSGFFLKSSKQYNLKKYLPFTFIIAIICSTIIVYFLKDVEISLKCSISIFICFIYIFILMRNKSFFEKLSLNIN